MSIPSYREPRCRHPTWTGFPRSNYHTISKAHWYGNLGPVSQKGWHACPLSFLQPLLEVSDLDQEAWSNNLPSQWGAYAVQSQGPLFGLSLGFWSWKGVGMVHNNFRRQTMCLGRGGRNANQRQSRCTSTSKRIRVSLGKGPWRKGFLMMWFQLHCIFLVKLGGFLESSCLLLCIELSALFGIHCEEDGSHSSHSGRLW